jgi:hypothetical protein
MQAKLGESVVIVRRTILVGIFNMPILFFVHEISISKCIFMQEK